MQPSNASFCIPSKKMAPVTNEETRGKRKRYSKKLKKTWRKHSKVGDVEEFLEEKRQEERTGGPVAKKKDSQLFFVDKPKKQVRLAIRQKRTNKTPLLTPNVKGFPARKIAPHGIKKKKTVKQKIPGETIRKIEPVKRLTKREKRLIKPVVKTPKKTELTIDYDIWEDKDTEANTILDKDVILFNQEQLRKRPITAPRMRKKVKSLIPAVEPPHPGTSYNPAYDDHQALLRIALDEKLAEDKKQRHLYNALVKFFPDQNEAQTAEKRLEEMSAGLFDESSGSSSDSSDDSSDDDDERERKRKKRGEEAADPEVEQLRSLQAKNRKRLAKKRRREGEQKAREKEAQHKKLLKKRMNDVFRIKSIRKTIRAAEVVAKKRKARKDVRDQEKLYKPAKLSKYKYQAPQTEYNLTRELSGNLRSMKSEGNLLLDRFKSMQRRNILEPRIRQVKKRTYKMKAYVKRGHKIEEA